ncbi:Ras-related protein Rab-4A [Taenia crassiceps]|uniref:Ras-related protein Rab-4A n=1 Tax=Taenia crassiceps TaxID=6207 RepID=A0ABR4QK96_9CEST
MVDSYDYLLKFLIIGDASTGKTCVEFGTKVIQIGERFQCVTRSYYRGAAGALVVYDISCLILVGNKSDLAAEHREVNEEEARQFAKDNGVHDFIETSAKFGDNVQEAFYAAARTALERAKATQSTDAFLPASIRVEPAVPVVVKLVVLDLPYLVV